MMMMIVGFTQPVAGGKHDMLLAAGPASQGLPIPDALPFSHGDVSFIQRQHARER